MAWLVKPIAPFLQACARKLQLLGRPRNSKPWRWIELIEMTGAIIRSCGARFAWDSINSPWYHEKRREREKELLLRSWETSLSSIITKTSNYNLIINLSSLDGLSRNEHSGQPVKITCTAFPPIPWIRSIIHGSFRSTKRQVRHCGAPARFFLFFFFFFLSTFSRFVRVWQVSLYLIRTLDRSFLHYAISMHLSQWLDQSRNNVKFTMITTTNEKKIVLGFLYVILTSIIMLSKDYWKKERSDKFSLHLFKNRRAFD